MHDVVFGRCVNPAKANEIFVRAMQYGENRVITGAHWQSDVDMMRLAAAIAYSRLQTLPAFRLQMELAKDKFTTHAKRTLTDYIRTSNGLATIRVES